MNLHQVLIYNVLCVTYRVYKMYDTFQFSSRYSNENVQVIPVFEVNVDHNTYDFIEVIGINYHFPFYLNHNKCRYLRIKIPIQIINFILNVMKVSYFVVDYIDGVVHVIYQVDYFESKVFSCSIIFCSVQFFRSCGLK